MHRYHAMPFGTELLPNGRVRFRLWAPGAQRVELCLGEGETERLLPMEPQPGGWWEAFRADAPVGSAYRFRIDGDLRVPDPASRGQVADVHGPSRLSDPRAWAWQDQGWRGRLWEEAVFYELHVGSFSPGGDFAGVEARLDHLAALGITAIELMPVADFPGGRNWGYDGVLPFAPDRSYGPPEALKSLVQAAHRRGLMVFLDVVYNHFGPEGNYLWVYARPFFTDRHHTPWGSALNFDGAESRAVREFFIHNALYWLEEYHLDGLRLDAVHAILDDGTPDLLTELAERVREGPGRARRIHLVLENDANQARYLGGGGYRAQWNDDLHHALHVLLTGEGDGYYADYVEHPLQHLGRALAEGFAYQGEASPYRHGAARGEASGHLAPTAFVNFLQTHDQVGNRAFGERLAALCDAPALEAAVAILLLSPAPPLLFMGEEWASRSPFPFFCDFGPDLAAAVSRGRREEFARFERFRDPAVRAAIPDPNAVATFASARLDWTEAERPDHRAWLGRYRGLLALRRREIVPRLAGSRAGRFEVQGGRVLRVEWPLGDGSRLSLVTHLHGERYVWPREGGAERLRPGSAGARLLYASPGDWRGCDSAPPWAVACYLTEDGDP